MILFDSAPMKMRSLKDSKVPYLICFTERLDHRVRAWNPSTDEIWTIAGLNGELEDPYGLALSAEGDLIIADKKHHGLLRLRNGTLQSIATHDGDGHRSLCSDQVRDQPHLPTGIVGFEDQSLLVSYGGDNTIYHIQKGGTLQHVIGRLPHHRGATTTHDVVSEDGIRDVALGKPTSLAVHPDGRLYFIERDFQNVREYIPGHGMRFLFKPVHQERWKQRMPVPDAMPMDEYHPAFPTCLAIDADGKLYLCDASHRCIWLLDMKDNRITCIARFPCEDAQSGGPAAITFGPDGEIWVCDYGNGRVVGLSRTHQTQTSHPTQKEALVAIAKNQGAGIVCVPIESITRTM